MNAPKVYPADFAGVISVAATDQLDRRASFSNYGRPVATGAPGVDIIGPYANGQYAKGSGTSYSTPWVAGQAALLLSRGVTPSAVLSRIVNTADDITLVICKRAAAEIAASVSAG